MTRADLVEVLLLLAVCSGAVLLYGCGEVESAEVTAKIVAEVDEKKALPPQVLLSHPLNCSAIVMYSGTPGEMPRTRCYVRSQQ
jgi:hypothetical protein